jgi:hypothetical protein
MEKDGVLIWRLPELSKNNGTGTLRAVLNYNSAGASPIPSNTYVNFQVIKKINDFLKKTKLFQIPDFSISGASIHLNDQYVLSLFRKKVIAGKYFCEPTTKRDS